MTLTRLYCGGNEDIDIANESGSWGTGANLKGGKNCHDLSHFVGWKPVIGASGYVVERRPLGGSWFEVYRESASTFLDNMTTGGKFEYRWKPLGEGGIEGQWSEPILYIVKPPPITLTVSKTCDRVFLSWNDVGAVEYIILKNDIRSGYAPALSSSWTGSVNETGTFTYKVRGYIDLFNEGAPGCYSEGIAVVSVLAPQSAGTVLKSGCVGKQDITTVADGHCGENPIITAEWQCDGCFNPQTGLIGAKTCSGNNVTQAEWSGTCDNNITTKTIEFCGSLGCRGGECVRPANCADMTNSIALGLGNPDQSTINYDFGNRNVDAICVNVQSTWSNVSPSVAVFLNGLRVCMASISSDNVARDILLVPPWSLNYGDRDPLSGTYTAWNGHITIVVSAQGQLYHGEVRLNRISWRNV